MSEEIKNSNESAELNEDQLEDVAGGCGHHDYGHKHKDKDYGDNKSYGYKYKGEHGYGDKYKYGGKH